MSRQIRELWRNDDGADAWEEANDGRRIFWTPKGEWPAGPNYDGIVNSAAQSHIVDTFRGGPAVRREHVHEIPTAGFDRMFVQWSGECVSSQGFGNNAPAGTARNFWGDQLNCTAHGIGFVDPRLDHTAHAPVFLENAFNKAIEGTMGNSLAGGSLAAEAEIWASGNKLMVMGPGLAFPNLQIPRAQMFLAAPQALAFGKASTPLHNGNNLFRGWTETDGGGVFTGRMPGAGDRYGFNIAIGWPSSANVYFAASPNEHETTGPLTISPFDKIEMAIYSTASVLGSPEFVTFGQGAGGTNNHIVKGVMYAILVRDDGIDFDELIDRDNRVVNTRSGNVGKHGPRFQ